MENEKVKQIHALVQLLDDSDERIVYKLKQQLHAMGEEIIPYLEGEWEQMEDEQVRETIEAVIHDIQFNHVVIEFSKWVSSEQHNLLEAYLLLTKFAYPDVNVIQLKLDVEKIARDIWIELNDNLTGLEEVKVMNHIIYDLCKFKLTEHEDAPACFYLNNLLETHTGNAMSLAMLYLITCRINEIDVMGVDLRGHFILAIMHEPFDIEEPLARTKQVLFYLNPAQRGTVFTRAEIELYIKEMQWEQQDQFFQPCSDKQIILRFIAELMDAYRTEDKPDKVEELQQLRDLLD